MRGKTYERPDGSWEKIEIELEGQDLLPEEQGAPTEVQPQLLELRVERHLVIYLRRAGKLSEEEAKAHLSEIDSYRKKLLAMRPRPKLAERFANGKQDG